MKKIICVIALCFSFVVAFAEAVDKADSKNALALRKAIEKDDLKKTAKLIKKGTDVNLRLTDNGLTPLMVSIDASSLSVVQFLLDNGADINAQTNTGETALTYAINYENLPIVSLLIKNKANVNINNGKALFDACQKDVEFVKLLLESDANINVKNEYGDTPLIQSAKNCDYPMVSFLVENKANINAQNKEGYSALFYAIAFNEETIADALKKAGAKLTRAEEKELEQKKMKEQIAQERLLVEKRQSADNFYNQVIRRKGIPLEIGDNFSIQETRLEVIDRIRDNEGYTYLVTFWSSAAEDSIDYGQSFFGGGVKYCFYIQSKKEIDVYQRNLYPIANKTVITNRNPLKIVCSGIGQYQRNYQDVDAYIFTLVKEGK